ncbi:MAG: hypothetical protein OXC91_07605 [Rhodobacteraceae bacterium]|nr:hypothetical protein [Paracoccaceae bacterium]
MNTSGMVTPRFRRSIRLDTDFRSATAIDGFHCPASFRAVLKLMADHIIDTEHAAFTWTGPYGGGKSSLAVALACLFGAPKPIREAAVSLFGDDVVGALKSALPYFPSRWDVLPLVVERRSMGVQLAECLALPPSSTSSDILKELQTRTQRRGLLLIMDELGRGLEAAADGDGDLDLLQDMAELSARSQGRFIFLGILHQAFAEYADRLGHKARDSWAKIQGRFVDISISVTLEETLELVSDALGQKRAAGKAIKIAEDCVIKLRPGRKKTEAKRLARKLARTAPLHPFTACLLGPLSRRRFGQNQRSLFSFLNSSEPYGLQYSMKVEAKGWIYPPHLLWNYLQSNFEASILSSPDGRRWAMAHEVLDRCLANGASELEQFVLRTIAILELLKESSGLIADFETIALSLHTFRRTDVERALSRLERQSAIVFRKHSGAYVLYAGSDFDVEAHLREILSEPKEIDLNLVRSLADLQPMLAKRHHEKTGAMRWFEMAIDPVSELEEPKAPENAHDIIGRIVFPLPMAGESLKAIRCACEQAASSTKATFPLIVGYHDNPNTLLDHARELAGLNELQHKFPELQGDPIARREIDARTAEVRQQIEAILYRLIDECRWCFGKKKAQRLNKRQLNETMSDLADQRYRRGPVIRNELLNCSKPSSNAVGARTRLMKRMVMRGSETDLGFEGDTYPAERGLYISLLKETGVHRNGLFKSPPKTSKFKLSALWHTADSLLSSCQGTLGANEILDAWAQPPIGLKPGLGPVFLSAYIFSRRDRVAVYGDGVFQAKFNELCVEFLVRDPRDIQLRNVEMEGFIGETLEALGRLLNVCGTVDPLSVARTLIGEFDALVRWTARTQSLSPQTLKVREILKRANDPNKLLFDDLPSLTEPLADGSFDAAATAILLRDALAEMRAAYPKALDALKALMLRELDVRSQTEDAFTALRARADNIHYIGGDLRQEAFVGRLTQFHGTQEDMEGLVGIAANKLPRDWNDGDHQRAAVGLAELAKDFLKTETMARVKGRKDGRHAMAVVVGKENMPHSLFHEIQVADGDWGDVETLAGDLDRALSEADQQKREIILAALIEVTSKYLNTDDEVRVGEHA